MNVEGTRHLLDAAEEAGVRRVVVVSSNSPFGFNPHRDHRFDERVARTIPYMGYGRSKRRMEALVQAGAGARASIETVIIRPPWFYGPHQPPRQTLFFKMIKDGRFPILGDGTQKRSMAYVDNICQGLLLAATAPACERRDLLDRRRAPVRDQRDRRHRAAACSRTSSASPARRGSAAAGRWSARWRGWCDGALQAVGLYNQKIHVLSEMNQTIACSIDKAKRELGYAPTVALREGMRESVRWCLANGLQF